MGFIAFKKLSKDVANYFTPTAGKWLGTAIVASNGDKNNIVLIYWFWNAKCKETMCNL